MNPHHNSRDPLDQLLTRQPLQPDDAFTERVMGRIQADQHADDQLDALLASRPVHPSPGFTDRTLAAIKAESATKLTPFPAWAIALGGMAAALVAGIIAFAALVQSSTEPTPERVAEHAIPALDASLPATQLAERAVTAPDTDRQAADALPDDAAEWEELLMMEAALSDAVPITERENWQALAMLTQ